MCDPDRRRGGWVWRVVPVLFLAGVAGCAGRGEPPGPVVSPTGIVYEPGVPPVESRYSQTATLYLRQGLPDRALELSREGIAEDPGNPIHHFLAGTAAARLGMLEEADRYFVEAEQLYPAYELDVEPARESAWAEAFNAGMDALGEGRDEETEALWRAAARIFELRPEAHEALASLLANQGRFSEAADAVRGALDGLGRLPATRVLEEDELLVREAAAERLEGALGEYLFLADRFEEAEPLLRARVEREPGNAAARSDLAAALLELGRTDEARQVWAELLEDPGVGSSVLFGLGISSFRAQAYGEAAEIFGELVDREPGSRDAWFNYANALFASEDWEGIVREGDRLLGADPLSETLAIIRARAHLELGDEGRARGYLEEILAAPLFLEGLQLSAQPGETRVRGTVVGNREEGGGPVRIRFVFLSDGEEAGEAILEIQAPVEGETRPLEVRWEGVATAYRYEILP